MATTEPEAARRADLDANDQADMLTLAREALEDWRHARDRSAASVKASRRLAFAFSRLDHLGAFERIERGAYK